MLETLYKNVNNNTFKQEEIDTQLNTVVDLIKYLTEKDKFLELYKDRYAKRILRGK